MCFLLQKLGNNLETSEKTIFPKNILFGHVDENNQLIGVPQTQFGVINYQAKKLGLCMGLTDAEYVTTTEVYPDSPQANDDICIDAQVASISGALNYIVNK